MGDLTERAFQAKNALALPVHPVRIWETRDRIERLLLCTLIVALSVSRDRSATVRLGVSIRFSEVDNPDVLRWQTDFISAVLIDGHC